MSILFVEDAIQNFLTADAELVGLTGHSATDVRIYAGYPDDTVRYPCIAYWYETIINYNPYIDEQQKALFNFGVFTLIENSKTYNSWTTKGQLLHKRTTDRLQQLFQTGNMKDAVISSSQVKIVSALFHERLPIRFDDDLDEYRSDITVFINWYNL